MLLDSSVTLDYHAQAPVAAIFMLRPRSGWAQWIVREEYLIKPSVQVVEFTDLYGNLCQKLVIPEGPFSIATQCRASVPDDIDVDASAEISPVAQLPPEVLHYLLPSRYCQSDKLGDLATSIVGPNPTSYQQVAQIRAWIHANVTYESGASDSSTSALETSQTLRGVCRDFAHLGISLCRAINVPARMVVGFLHELEPMDLHAWFEAYVGGRWFTIDATEDFPKGNRIVVAYGRDAADVAISTIFGSIQFKGMKTTVTAVKEDPSE